MKNKYHSAMSLKHPSIRLVILGTGAGLCSGAVTLLYRLALGMAESLSFQIYAFLRSHLIFVPIWLLILILLALFVSWCSGKLPMIGGSGIPQVKGLLDGHLQDHPVRTLTAKFFIGVISIIAGLSLGREGPSIQLGACAADALADKTAKSDMERKLIMASGAGAGLSAAFGAPLSAVVFTVEELYGHITPVILLTTMTASVSAQCLGAFFFGLEPIFDFHLAGVASFSDYYILIFLGVFTGFCGAFYNHFLVRTQQLYNKLPFAKGLTRCLPAFITAGILGLVFPYVLCGGHEILHFITPETSIRFLLLLLLVKFLFSMLSFESGAPGGIFFPLLIMGSLIGAIFGKIAMSMFGLPESYFYGIIVLSMAGFFTAIVRAPLTGIVLLLEMTGSFTQLLPFSIVCILAYITAYILRSEPIYESLLQNLLQKFKNQTAGSDNLNSKKTLFEVITKQNSAVIGKTIKELSLPPDNLIISIRRHDTDIIPRGDTVIQTMDTLLIISDTAQEGIIRQYLD